MKLDLNDTPWSLRGIVTGVVFVIGVVLIVSHIEPLLGMFFVGVAFGRIT